LTSLNQTDINLYFEKAVNDHDWLIALKSANALCIQSDENYIGLYQKELNVTTEVCDTRYVLFMDCLTFFSSIVSNFIFNFNYERNW